MGSLNDSGGNVISYGLGDQPDVDPNQRFSLLIKDDTWELEIVGQSNDINTGIPLNNNIGGSSRRNDGRNRRNNNMRDFRSIGNRNY